MGDEPVVLPEGVAEGATPDEDAEDVAAATAAAAEPGANIPWEEVKADLHAGVGDEEPLVRKAVTCSLDELKARARRSATREGKLARAKPFPLPDTLGCEVMVAAPGGMDFYRTLFQGRNALMKARDAGEEDSEAEVGVPFIKRFVMACVVEPVLDEEALDLIVEANVGEFNALAAYCQDLVTVAPTEAIGKRLGQIDTEAQEGFFGAMVRSMSGPTPL